ncbi:MAG: cell division protein FtsQ/DivIB [Candidatus Edwardsbacteria bacterium]|nr:cell division protein FtsQ/DivIB [Candidatus Edwardsbacteria bacterium]
MTAYFDRKSAGRLRKKHRQKGKLKAILGLIVLSATLAAGIYGYRQGLEKGIFNIKQVNISGNRMADTAGIMEIAGELSGRVLWRAEYRKAAVRICQKYPAVKRAKFTVWPWGIADLHITERKPLAELQHDGQLVIDPEGVIFRAARMPADRDREKLPRLKTNGAGAHGVWRALRLMEAAPWLENQWLFDPTDEKDIKLWLPGGVAVHFGNGHFKKEWQKLGEVLENLKRENLTATEIDLRFNGQAIIKGQALVQGMADEAGSN